MRLFIYFVTFFLCIGQSCYAQINKDYLYGRYWRIETDEVIQGVRTITMYNRITNKGLNDFSSIMVYYSEEGTKSGFDAAGRPFSSSWQFVSDNQIKSNGDKFVANIIKLTDKEFLVEVPQTYKHPFTGIETPMIWRTKYVSFNPCVVYESLRSGPWNDPTIWTCQKVPTADNLVQINEDHELTIPDNYKANAKQLKHIGKLKFGENAKLELSK